MTTNDSTEHLLAAPPVPSYTNFRDISLNSSKKIQPNKIFRSSMFFDSTIIRNHNISSCLDLRSAKDHPVVAPSDTLKVNLIPLVSRDTGIALLKSLPLTEKLLLLLTCFRNAETTMVRHIMQDSTSLYHFYLEMVESGRDELRRVFTVLSNPNSYPLVIHCVAGKDRTGVIVAFIYELLSVPVSCTVYDYSISEEELRQGRSAMGDKLHKASHVLLDPKMIRSPPRSMEMFMDAIKTRYESVEKFLVGHVGVKQEEVDSVRSILSNNSV